MHQIKDGWKERKWRDRGEDREERKGSEMEERWRNSWFKCVFGGVWQSVDRLSVCSQLALKTLRHRWLTCWLVLTLTLVSGQFEFHCTNWTVRPNDVTCLT